LRETNTFHTKNQERSKRGKIKLERESEVGKGRRRKLEGFVAS